MRAPQARFNGLGFYGLGFCGLVLLCPNRVGSGFQDTLFPQRRFHPHARQLDEFLSGFGRICLLGQFKAFTRVGVVLFRFGQHHGHTTLTADIHTLELCDAALTCVLK